MRADHSFELPHKAVDSASAASGFPAEAAVPSEAVYPAAAAAFAAVAVAAFAPISGAVDPGVAAFVASVAGDVVRSAVFLPRRHSAGRSSDVPGPVFAEASAVPGPAWS